MRRITVAQRRARLGVRHLLAGGADTPEQVARAMVALHSTDPSTVYLSTLARMSAGDLSTVERALYEDRSLLRLLAMRRTVFVVPTELAPFVHVACSLAVGATQRKLMLKLLAESEVADPPQWLAETERLVLEALTARGEATAAELTAEHPRLATEVVLSRGKPYEGRQRVGGRVLALLATQGHVVRGRPLGGWTSTQFRWSPAARWSGELAEVSTVEAENTLARGWLAAFGPATVEDLRWWTGWSLTQTRRVLGRIAPEEVDLDGEPGIALAGDEDVPAPEPWVALLPALDPTPMGWVRRDFFLGEHAPQLFDRTGNISPTVWVDGRVVGGWAQRADGEVAYRLLEGVGADSRARLDQAAERLAEVLGPVRLTARARQPSPVERALLA